MQTVPSLIGAGTAVAAAATGLAFGELSDGQTPPQPDLNKRKSIISERDFLNVFSSSRPGTTSSTAPNTSNNAFTQDSNRPFPSINATAQPRIPRRPSHTQITPPKSSAARYTSVRQGEFAPASPIVEDSRDSLSSNGSWMRRLSIRPLSQHESLRSSIGPDSPSITFSHGSAAPILGAPGHSSPQLPPNKLVKRASAINGGETGSLVRRGSRAQMTLRRPATSHQRSATLHQQINAETLPPLPKISFDSRPRAQTLASPQEPVFVAPAEGPSTWKSFWHSRISRYTTKSSSLRSGDNAGLPDSKRICVEHQGQRRAFLIAPRSLIMGSSASEVPVETLVEPESPTNTDGSPQSSEKSSGSPEATPSKQPKRSMSMHFSSPTNWISKTGSLRRRKRGDTVGGTKRHVSAPVTTETEPTTAPDAVDHEENSKEAEEPRNIETDLPTVFRPNRKRNSSSPLPPITRLSSFHIDLNKLGSMGTGQSDELTTNSASSQRVVSNTSQARTFDRSSTTASSEYHRGFTSGDDDDTDFKTDTPFDSFRTVASGRRRTLDSPLESMFDESPPSTAGNNSKPKRLSIQEIMGPAFDIGNKIMEEDEGLSTPIRGVYEDEDGFESNPVSPTSVIRRDDPRFSFDDDDDDLDWDKEEDDGIYNHLSPPSSMNSRRGSPNSRTALASINGNARPTARSNARTDPARERPRSTVFDWTEPTAHEKHDGDGSHARPKTVHGKQEIDVRGGRSANRKGPTPAHVRSQSVPVVPEQSETTSSTPKFGTWGLGQKNASEDWDDDFEFEEEDDFDLSPSKRDEGRFAMVVPASIQATQPTIKAHSGQIRELSLLVNDLKRLCRLGREMDMLSGTCAKLWREAEGIIALASPDEEPSEASESRQGSSSSSGDLPEVRFVDQGLDGASLDIHGSSRVSESQRNAVVRDRPVGRRRSVFSPDDDIFGTWDQADEEQAPVRPRTPENRVGNPEFGSSSVARSVMEAMHSRQSRLNASREENESSGKLNFDTNSLKELVKRASDLRDGLSDVVRKADHLTQSPARTPKHTRADGSPAFTRVFDEPTSSPTRRLPHSQSNNSILSNGSVGASPSNGISQRMQMMTVS
ncbi:uncharacterized protein F4822DRAFT_277420 [Hypoxylon trugodes]|uniref:uncharacterized protein n=1 Tax=Hypoxylon trugodes TaxID=326681 RepID=UPI00219F4D75|nr:uncharacterized protein F4822DRAFT_277420 [Hypoxylon trugodes]KAI1387251.1 hypothetical protein F4822DRAFT_277420 [Hypoxylon trugodes]